MQVAIAIIVVLLLVLIIAVGAYFTGKSTARKEAVAATEKSLREALQLAAKWDTELEEAILRVRQDRDRWVSLPFKEQILFLQRRATDDSRNSP